MKRDKYAFKMFNIYKSSAKTNFFNVILNVLENFELFVACYFIRPAYKLHI